MIAVAATRSLNAPLPCTAERCRDAIAIAVAGFTKPTPKAGAKLVDELVSCYPHLTLSRVFIGKLSLVFEAHSIAAARHLLDPVTGFVGKPDWLSIGNINTALQAFEDEQRAVIAAAEWIIAEHARRDAEAATAKQVEAEKATFLERHEGKSPLEFARAQLTQ